MVEIKLSTPQKAYVSLSLLQSELSKALETIFKSSSVEVEKQLIDTDLMLIMSANGIRAILHIQEDVEVREEVAI